MVSSVCTRTGIRCAATRALRRLWLRLRPGRLSESRVHSPREDNGSRGPVLFAPKSHLWVIDRIHIEQLEVHGRVGVRDSERAEPQRLSLSVTLWPKIAELRDNIANTVNYSAVAECAKEFVNQSDYKLIETLAEEMAAYLLAQFN